MKRDFATILILSSEPAIRSVMREVLERAGYIVMASGDLGVAVDMMSDCAVNLLITHPYVDSMTGYEAARYLRKRNHEMGVLIVAGVMADDRIQLPGQMENFEVFPRPFSAAEFVHEVAHAIQLTRERTERNTAARNASPSQAASTGS